MVNDLPAEWIADPALDVHDSTRPTILYLHGGAFTDGSIAAHRALCGNLAHASQARVLLIEYRLAPEHPFPAALDDTVAAYRWLLKTRGEPQNLFVAGDSSGGGLALSALIVLRDNRTPLSRAAACLSAIIDLVCNNEIWDTNGAKEIVTTVGSARRSVSMYLNRPNPHTPLASPLYADLSELPPIFLQVGSKEMMFADATCFAKKTHDAGVDVTLDVWPEMVTAGSMLPIFYRKA